jgi:transposase
MVGEAREVRVLRKDRTVLEARCRSPVTLQRDLKRARIVLLAAAGRSTRSIAKEVGVQPRIVSLWRQRFADHGLEGLKDKPRPGKEPIYTKATDKRIVALLDKPPPKGFARWTGPLLAESLGDVDVQYVWRFLRRHQIDLQARKSWCESNDPAFASKAADVVGLYIAPPEKAIVLCVDEKPSIQALERAQGYLKLPNGRALTGQSHDYKRHGTTTLFAALEVATGKVVATHSKRRRRVEFLGFMNEVVTAFPASFTSSWIISAPTRTTSGGSKIIPQCNSTSRRRARHGSIRLKPGSPSCRASRSVAPRSPPATSYRTTSMPSSPPTTTKLNPSCGPRKRSVNDASRVDVSLSYDSGY